MVTCQVATSQRNLSASGKKQLKNGHIGVCVCVTVQLSIDQTITGNYSSTEPWGNQRFPGP